MIDGVSPHGKSWRGCSRSQCEEALLRALVEREQLFSDHDRHRRGGAGGSDSPCNLLAPNLGAASGAGRAVWPADRRSTYVYRPHSHQDWRSAVSASWSSRSTPTLGRPWPMPLALRRFSRQPALRDIPYRSRWLKLQTAMPRTATTHAALQMTYALVGGERTKKGLAEARRPAASCAMISVTGSRL